METRLENKSSRPKARQSLAHVAQRSNTTTDIAALKRLEEAQDRKKKSRGKSLGPGGLEALTETNLNVPRAASVFQPRSILKPSIPLTPPKAIPSFDELRKRSTMKAKSPAKNVPEDLLIDFSTPGPNREASAMTTIPGADVLVDPFSPVGSTKPVGGNQQADSVRQAERAAIIQRRNERRKSLANRRVSFAPEATLHTWSVMEMVEDSTTSSVTNSTRRQSSIAAAQSPAVLSSSPKTLENSNGAGSLTEGENYVTTSSEHPSFVNSPYQPKGGRLSESAQCSDEDSYSSPGDRAESSPIRVEESIDSDSDTDGDTAMSLDEPTQTSVRSSASTSSHTSLDERLRQAASQAGTSGFGPDSDETEDEDDQTMDIADGTTTYAFKPYSRRPQSLAAASDDDDKENVNHFVDMEASCEHETVSEAGDSTIGITMDMTRAVGGIVPHAVQPTSTSIGRRKSDITRRRSSTGNTTLSEENMDLTVAKGGIISTMDSTQGSGNDESDEELTMEMTAAVGAFPDSSKHEASPSNNIQETESMELTMAAGTILPPIEERTEPQSFVEGSQTVQMDFTNAVGGILRHESVDQNVLADEGAGSTINDVTQLLEGSIEYPALSDVAKDVDEEQLASSTQLNLELEENIADARRASLPSTPAALESGSPTLKPRLSSRQNAIPSKRTTPRSAAKNMSPASRSQATPPKQITPIPAKSVSARRTPVLSANVTTRSASPKKLFVAEIQSRQSPATCKSPRTRTNLLFAENGATGLNTPRIVLSAPKSGQHLRRQSAGGQIPKAVTSSPQVAGTADRRKTIGEALGPFVLKQAKLQRESSAPLQMEFEVDAERAEEHRRESGRFIMEQEEDDQMGENTAQTLKDMIESMTPKKEAEPKKLKGRKSLAIGSAKGLLGKRPLELDEDEEESTPKRLRAVSRENSPVKKAYLRKPSKDLQNAELSARQSTPSLSDPIPVQAKSPDHTGRFKSPSSAQKATLFSEKLDNVVNAMDVSVIRPELADTTEEEPIALQDFLNMTNVHFIELSTTKRRHTLAQPMSGVENSSGVTTPASIFVAASTTLPMLELYQHATRELKTYITAGRSIIRQIEQETLAQQPTIFRQYIDARPEVKMQMDQQFRNGKTNARLQSKEGWYSWRSELTDGLSAGLQSIHSELKNDFTVLTRQEANTQRIVNDVHERKRQLNLQAQELRNQLQHHEIEDQDLLTSQRGMLVKLDQDVIRRAQHAAEFQSELDDKDEVLTQAAELRQEMREQIQEAARVQNEQKSWQDQDIISHRASLEDLERRYGWKIFAATEDAHQRVMLILDYQDVLRLKLCPTRAENMAVLKYEPDEFNEQWPKTLPADRHFFLTVMQDSLETATAPQICLALVSQGWLLADKVSREIKALQAMGIVKIASTVHSKLDVRLMLVHSPRLRVDVNFTLTAKASADGTWSTSTSVTARPMYGVVKDIMDISRTRKVEQALAKELESSSLGDGAWLAAVKGFSDWLDSQVQARVQANVTQRRVLAEMPEHEAAQTQPTDTERERRRATTQSPQRAATPKKPSRSPLAPKTTNSRVVRKALPVPKKPMQTIQLSQESHIPVLSQQKENILSIPGKVISDGPQLVAADLIQDDVFASVKPAIPPDMQEAMLQGTPRKRVGALRRSPI